MARNVKGKPRGRPKGSRNKPREVAHEPIGRAVCPKTVLMKLIGQCQDLERQMAADRGDMGQQVAEAVARHHLHPIAFRIARRLEKMNEGKRAETMFHLTHYIQALGLDRQEDLLPDRAPPWDEQPVKESDPDAMEQVGRGTLETEEMPRGPVN